jgi:dGTPase
VVTELERRYSGWPGLNLTIETLEGIAKHETEYDLSQITGFNADERGSLEAQIANIADELAYNAHDLDDGIQSGLIDPDALNELEIWRELCDRLDWRGGKLDEITRHRFIREQIGIQVDDVLDEAARRLALYHPQTPDDIKCAPGQIIAHSERFTELNRALKRFLFANMYHHYSIMRMTKRAERFITEIFSSYVTEPRQLPAVYQAQLKESSLQRVVADYIASMTDRSALLEYRRLVDPLTGP